LVQIASKKIEPEADAGFVALGAVAGALLEL
jgi:hypothetical protein